MNEQIEVSAKTVDEAVEQALHDLGLRRDQVEVEVLSSGTRGRFGIGADPARIVVRPLAPHANDDATLPETTPVAVTRAKRAEPEAEDEEAGPLPFDDEAVTQAADILRELLRLIDIEGQVEARPPATPGDGLGQASAVLDVVGEDLGLLIGRRGETLAALQYMVNLLLNRGAQGRLSITVDIEGYRRRREERLVAMAQHAAADVEASGDTVWLEPMPANERRIIHVTLSDDERVTTSSEGVGISRRVAISPRHT